ncbi:sensor domain-containing diguanylate cyclase [Desulfovibrio intestinalis]|uniref:Diguanylate cyclase (GGDEF)-like protein n=1 Tax=Desulfovibrio intestinalis TaxID=58621 RepID=A0A7W8BZG0_9BACT|nr:cache domain-containing protein [Desulfovibrio intestinalis]MBB5142531.1 diguanylate cyclase (GGDEF)-like protein [Desulfovibrio intestinalis]
MYRSKRQIKRIYAIAFLVGGLFLVCSLMLLRYATGQVEQVSIVHLYETTTQLRVLLQRQLTQNFQTLNSLAITVGYMPQQKTLPLLKEINSNSDFIRIGIANSSGKAEVADAHGTVYHDVDLSSENFFRRALAGHPALSPPRRNPRGPGRVIYCAVPVEQDSKINEVLFGVTKAEVFLNILETPLFNATGFAALIDAQGRIVLSPELSPVDGLGSVFNLGHIGEADRRNALDGMAHGRRSYFLYENGKKQYLAAFDPIQSNDWFLFCAVPLDALGLVSPLLLYGGGVVTILALLCFIFLTWRVYRLTEWRDRQLQKLAFVDPVTGGINSHRLRLEATALLHEHPNMVFAIWLADIKNFKFYNKMLGVEAGDRELRRIARVLEKEGQGPLARCCHISGDTFAGILPFAGRESIIAMCARAASDVENGAYQSSHIFPLRLHIGIYTTDTVEDEEIPFMEMINRASIALLVAKTQDESAFHFYTDEICDHALRLCTKAN